MGAEERLATEDGAELWLRVVGEGPTTVIVPNAVYLERDFAWLSRGRRVVFYDLRGRGRSSPITESTRLGIDWDVADLEAVRSHLGIDRAALLGHSYLGLMVVLYALARPDRVDRLVQIGPAAPPSAGIEPSLAPRDALALEHAREQMQRLERSGLRSRDPLGHCKSWWTIFSELMVTRPALASQVAPGICRYPNEHPGPMLAQVAAIQISLADVRLEPDALADLACPVLTVHGRRDRNVPFAAGRWWVEHLGNARGVAIEDAAHVPWLEAPERVEQAMREFLS